MYGGQLFGFRKMHFVQYLLQCKLCLYNVRLIRVYFPEVLSRSASGKFVFGRIHRNVWGIALFTPVITPAAAD